MSLNTSSVIFIDGCAVCKFPDNQIRIKPLKWFKEEKVSFPDKVSSVEKDESNILQKLSDGKVTFDDIVLKYF